MIRSLRAPLGSICFFINSAVQLQLDDEIRGVYNSDHFISHFVIVDYTATLTATDPWQ